MIHRLLVLSAVLAIASAAEAQITSVRVSRENNVSNANKPAGTTTSWLKVSSGSDLSRQELRVILTSGSIYQVPAPFGGDTPPSSAFFAFSPTLPWDSFVSMGGATAETTIAVLQLGQPINIPLSGIPPFGSTAQFDTAGINTSWQPAPGQATGAVNDFLTAQITLSDDSVGSLIYFGSTTNGMRVYSASTPIVNGFIGGLLGPVELELIALPTIPEPSGLLIATFGVAAVLSVAPHRRSAIRRNGSLNA